MADWLTRSWSKCYYGFVNKSMRWTSKPLMITCTTFFKSQNMCSSIFKQLLVALKGDFVQWSVCLFSKIFQKLLKERFCESNE